MTTTTTTESPTTTPTPAPKPEPVKATTVTLRHPGGLGDITFGEYRTEQTYTFNPATQAELIQSLKNKGFLIQP